MLDKILQNPTAEELRSFAEDIGAWTREKVETAVMRRPENQAILFRGWCEANLEDGEVKRWIGELSDQGGEILVRQVGRFLAEFDLEIEWLFQDRPTPPPELSANLIRLIENYCNACRWAVESYDEGKRYKRLERMARLSADH